jgi:hypothetical protein
LGGVAAGDRLVNLDHPILKMLYATLLARNVSPSLNAGVPLIALVLPKTTSSAIY